MDQSGRWPPRPPSQGMARSSHLQTGHYSLAGANAGRARSPDLRSASAVEIFWMTTATDACEAGLTFRGELSADFLVNPGVAYCLLRIDRSTVRRLGTEHVRRRAPVI